MSREWRREACSCVRPEHVLYPPVVVCTPHNPKFIRDVFPLLLQPPGRRRTDRVCVRCARFWKRTKRRRRNRQLQPRSWPRTLETGGGGGDGAQSHLKQAGVDDVRVLLVLVLRGVSPPLRSPSLSPSACRRRRKIQRRRRRHHRRSSHTDAPTTVGHSGSTRIQPGSVKLRIAKTTTHSYTAARKARVRKHPGLPIRIILDSSSTILSFGIRHPRVTEEEDTRGKTDPSLQPAPSPVVVVVPVMEEEGIS